MKKIYDILSAFVFIIVCLLSVIFAKEMSSILKDGIYMCALTVIPSLFPFMVITRFFSSTPILMRAGSLLSPAVTFLTGIKRELCGSFLMGTAGGFPNGAVSAGILYSSGKCTKSEAEYALALSNNCSLIFITAIAGTYALGSIKNGIILLCSQLITILINARLLRFCAKSRTIPKEEVCILNSAEKDTSTQNKNITGLLSAFLESVNGAASSAVNICAFILVFKLISETTSEFLLKNTEFLIVYKSFFEVTGAVTECRLAQFPINMILCSAALGFSGISVIFQVADVCIKYGLSPGLFIFTRITSAFIMPLCTLALLVLLPREAIYAFGSAGAGSLLYPAYTQINLSGIIAVYVLFTFSAIAVLLLCGAAAAIVNEKSLKCTKNKK